MPSANNIAGSEDTGAQDILLEKNNRAGIVTLNRPNALNAINDDMIREMNAFYVDCMEDPHIYGIVLRSPQEGVFSAGGDLRGIYEKMSVSIRETQELFATEYQHNWTLECFNKPNIALLNGIVMGGGVGISLYGTHQVAGEDFKWAMPEAGIGFFPDVGTAFSLARMPDNIGLYLGLTGRSLGVADAYWLKLISHFIPDHHYQNITAAMIESDPIDPILEDLHQDPGAGELERIRGWIDEAFSAPSIEEIMARLANMKGEGASWADDTSALLRQKCPLSLKITLRHIRQAALDKSRKDTLIRDYRLAFGLCQNGNFKEGIRALIIDKDNAPSWTPDDMAKLPDSEVDGLFASIGDEELTLVDYGEII